MLNVLDHVRRILSHPAAILIGVGLGFVFGLTEREFSQGLRPFAEIYVSLLSMCLLPILVSALVWGIGQSLRNADTRALFGRMPELARQPGQLGVRRESANAAWLRQVAPGAGAKEFESQDGLLQAVRTGKITAALLGEIPARIFLVDHPGAAIQLKLCEIAADRDHIAIAVRPDAPGLARWIDVFLAARGVSYDGETIVQHRGAWSFQMGNTN